MSPALMREPSLPRASILGETGQNLPTVLEEISADEPTARKTLLSWLQELTPMDVQGFEFPRDPSGRVHLQIVERNGRKVSAYSASDGTLRFLAILAALLNPNRGGIYFFEEIDAGIHPARLWLLLDFIEQKLLKETSRSLPPLIHRQCWIGSAIRPSNTHRSSIETNTGLTA